VNLKLTLEYDGAAFVGWQAQSNGRSVQAVLEGAIGRLCGEAVRITGAGRTDAGVHARGQVASLQTSRELPIRAWTVGLNALLPADLSCVRAEEAPPGFDARRWARGKRYVYSILETPVRSPLRRGRAWEIRRPLEVAAMRAAVPSLLGVHDFSALRAADCPARTTQREIRRLQVLQSDLQIDVVVEATAFLKHMVRNLVGTLVEVGHGRRAPDSLAALLEGRDRKRAGPTAPPHGLVLDEVFYLPGNADPLPAAHARAGPGPSSAAGEGPEIADDE
jgi:tRNA pseudouridine38-40 synthase